MHIYVEKLSEKSPLKETYNEEGEYVGLYPIAEGFRIFHRTDYGEIFMLTSWRSEYETHKDFENAKYLCDKIQNFIDNNGKLNSEHWVYDSVCYGTSAWEDQEKIYLENATNFGVRDAYLADDPEISSLIRNN